MMMMMRKGSCFVRASKLAFNRSSIVAGGAVLPSPGHPALTNYRRSLMTANTLISGAFNKFSPFYWISCTFPHTLFSTTHASKRRKFTGENGQTAQFDIPGTEIRTETDDRLCIFFDLGLKDHNINNADDLDDQKVLQASLYRYPNALFIKGYVQKNDLCRNYSARVNLPRHIFLSRHYPIKTEIKDGGLLVTLTKKPQN